MNCIVVREAELVEVLVYVGWMCDSLELNCHCLVARHVSLACRGKGRLWIGWVRHEVSDFERIDCG